MPRRTPPAAQCLALLDDLEPALRKLVRANDRVPRAVAEQRYDDVADAGGPIADAETAYEQALKRRARLV